MKFCTNCGTQLSDSAVFCTSCGKATEADTAAPKTTTNTTSGATFTTYHRAVATDRSLFMYIILTLVTCGIYGYIFTYKLAEDTNTMCFEDGEKTAGLGMYILLSILTCGIYSYWWMYKVQNRLCAAGPRYGIPIAENGTTVLMWFLFGILLCGIGPYIAMNIVINSANKIGTAYNMKYVYNK